MFSLPLSFGSTARRLALWARSNRGAVVGGLSLVAFAFVAIAISRITRDVSYDAVIGALAATPWSRLLAAIGFTALSFAFLICYDLDALRYVGRKLPTAQVSLIAFSAYAVGNTAGFGPLSGGAIRYRGYSRLGLTGEEIARVIAFVTLAFGIGLGALTGAALLIFADQVSGLVGIGAAWLRGGASALLAALACAMVWLRLNPPAATSDEAAGGDPVRLPRAGMVVWQLLITAGDVMAAASVLYFLLPGDLGLHWPAFAALFCVAIGIGVLSHVPAGLGVFEAVIIGGLGPSAPVDAVLGALVLYRLIYHVLPLFLAVIALVVTEVMEHRQRISAIWGSQVSVAVMPSLLAMLTLLCGVMLVFSSVIPTPPGHLEWLAGWFPISIVETAHFLSSLLGLLMVVVARGVVHRLDGAYWAALVLAALAAIFTIPKAVAAGEAVALGILVGGLALNRHLFTRRARLSEPLTPSWLAAIAVILLAATTILFFVYRDVDYSSTLWWQFEFSEEAPRGLRAMMGLSIAAVTLALASLMRPARARVAPASPDEIARAVAICEAQDESGGNLVRMGDKAVMFSDDGRAFVMYARQGRSWISLFGPIGAEDARPELIWRFVEAARAAGARAVFYEVPADLLPACADIGLRALKLGEMAEVDLEAMDFVTSRWGEQRRALAKGERDGMALEILAPDAVPAVLDDLERISQSWLAHHEAREKGFALGRFERDYVASQPVAVLRAGGQIVAFATLLLTETKAEATVDLMRFGADAPRGAMDFLFCALLAETKARGYRRFNLGMAPLSGFATHAAAPMWNHFGQTIFTHGERFYNFRGLRAFKAKFNPDWQPRYLIVGGGLSPVAALVDVALLIGGGLKGVVGK